jgi:hypothetical protein
MYVDDGTISKKAILQTNRLEIDTPGTPPPPYPPFGPNFVDQVYSNIPNNNVLGEPDAWIEIRYAGNKYSVPGYIF